VIINNLNRLLDLAFGQGYYTRDKKNYQVSCPVCKNYKKKKLHIKVDDLRYHCWVCDLKGKNVLYLIRKFAPSVEVDKYFKGKIFDSQEAKEEESKSLDLPPNVVPVYQKSSDPDIKAVKKYLIERGVSLEKMARWRMLATATGKYRRHVIIPSFDASGELNYYVGRAIDDSKFKYKNANAKKSEVIFNEIDMSWNKTVYIVEGVFDAINCPENTVPILGSSTPKHSLIYNELAKNQSDVIISLDPDMPEKSYDLAAMLSFAGCKTYVTLAPFGRDLGDLTSREVLKVLKAGVEYTPFLRISQKIGTIKSGSLF